MLEQEGKRRRLGTFSLGETFPTKERDRSPRNAQRLFFKIVLALIYLFIYCSEKKFLHTDRNSRIPYIEKA